MLWIHSQVASADVIDVLKAANTCAQSRHCRRERCCVAKYDPWRQMAQQAHERHDCHSPRQSTRSRLHGQHWWRATETPHVLYFSFSQRYWLTDVPYEPCTGPGLRVCFLLIPHYLCRLTTVYAANFFFSKKKQCDANEHYEDGGMKQAMLLFLTRRTYNTWACQPISKF